jgi:hypothetical protein
MTGSPENSSSKSSMPSRRTVRERIHRLPLVIADQMGSVRRRSMSSSVAALSGGARRRSRSVGGSAPVDGVTER